MWTGFGGNGGGCAADSFTEKKENSINRNHSILIRISCFTVSELTQCTHKLLIRWPYRSSYIHQILVLKITQPVTS